VPRRRNHDAGAGALGHIALLTKAATHLIALLERGRKGRKKKKNEKEKKSSSNGFFFRREIERDREIKREKERNRDNHTRLCAGDFRSASLLRRSPAPPPLLLVNWLLGLAGSAPPLSFLPLADSDATADDDDDGSDAAAAAAPLDDDDDEDAATTPSSSLPSLELIVTQK
jgi:hypothetical protein